MKKVDYNHIINLIKKKKKVYLDSFALEIGVPILETQRILNKLAEKQGAEVRVDKKGKLIYIFEKDLEFSDELLKFISTFTLEVFKFFKNIFVSVSKIMLLLVFISYSFIYIIILMLGFIASTIIFSAVEVSTTEVDETSVKTRNTIKVSDDYLKDFIEMMTYAFTLKSFHDNGYNENTKRPFHVKIFSFIFGDDVNLKTIDNDINTLSFIKEYHKITLSDVINLTGLTEKEAQQLILSLIVKYDGEILVNDDGIIYYTFNDFDFRGVKKNKFSYIWERKLPEYKLTRNDEDSNTKIIIFGIINIALSTIVTLGAFDDSTFIPKDIYSILKLWYGNISLFYSVIFFLIPALRAPFVAFKKKLSDKKNYVYYLFNDFSFDIGRDYVDMDETDDNAEVYLFKNYPNIFIHNFINNKDVIDLTRYHEEIKFTSDNNPKNIKIFNPDDVDFIDSFEDF